MKEFLDKRVYIITFIFGLGGGVLSKLLDIEEIGSAALTSLAVVFSFVVSLFISLLLRTRWNSKTKFRVKVISLCMLLISLALAYYYLDQYDNLTFTYAEGYPVDVKGNKVDLPSVRHLKGCWYTENAKLVRIQAANSNKGYDITDADLLVEYFGGLVGMKYVWNTASIRCAKRTILITYSLFVLTLSGTISLLSEVLYTRYKH